MSNNLNSLALIAEYDNSDTDSDEVVPGPRVSVKRCHDYDNPQKNKIIKQTGRLPVPAIIQTQKVAQNDDLERETHGGKIRSYPHERGNWSTYVYISFNDRDVIEDLINGIIITARNNNISVLAACDHLHISLTKTVIIRHHWIDSFTKTISDNISHLNKFVIFFENLKVYCNEERTRTFIGLQIKTGFDSMLNIVKILDKCLLEFNLPVFYENPSFHMSLVWCVGDHEEILNSILDQLNTITHEFMQNNPQMYINVNHLMCKTGNKYFNFNLCI